MLDSDQGALSFAADRLSHVLAQPIRCGDTDWGRRVQRALEALGQALERHVALSEAPTGLLGQVANRSLLPLTTQSRQGALLREEHAALRGATRSLEHQLESVLGFSEFLGALNASGADFREQCQAGAFRALHTVAHQAQQLLEAIRAHGAAEEELRSEASDSGPAASRAGGGLPGDAPWN